MWEPESFDDPLHKAYPWGASVTLPIPESDRDGLMDLLADTRPYVCMEGVGYDGDDPLHWMLFQQFNGHVRYCLILDRNDFTRVLDLAERPTSPPSKSHREAAAVMAVGGFLNMEYDPEIAAMEAASQRGIDRAVKELDAFACLQNVSPHVYLDIALGRRCTIEPAELQAGHTGHRPEKIRELLDPEVGTWEFDYGACLKVASLLRQAGPGVHKVAQMVEFLRWSFEEYAFSGPALLYGSLALSGRSQNSMFKHLHSSDEGKVLGGVRNAAWDVTLARQWMATRGYQNNILYLLCSFDRDLQRAARQMMGVCTMDHESAILDRMQRDWGKNARVVFHAYREYEAAMAQGKPRGVRAAPDGRAYLRNVAKGLEIRLEVGIRNGAVPTSEKRDATTDP